jgi:hypothetical protein
VNPPIPLLDPMGLEKTKLAIVYIYEEKTRVKINEPDY